MALRWAASDPVERQYLRSLLTSKMDEDAKLVIRDALAGKIRARRAATDEG